MWYMVLADFLVASHFAFILFAGVGGLLLLRWPRLVYLHVPAVGWAVIVELAGRICPLTPWENRLRALAGQQGYEGDFIGHYLLPLIYPAGLTRTIQVMLGALVLGINVVVYWYVFVKRRRESRNK